MTKYTRAEPALIEARQAIATFSLQRAAKRLKSERELRSLAIAKRKEHRSKVVSDDDNDEKSNAQNELTRLNESCTKVYKKLRKLALEGSQYADNRALSSICTKWVGGIPLVATASWTGSVHLFDGSSPILESLGKKTICHEDRIMGLSMQAIGDDGNSDAAMLATASIDMTGKLWKVQKSDVVMGDTEESTGDEQNAMFTLTEAAHLQGHAGRLCRTAFHPMKRHVATTSFDHTWRLWDVETGQNLLLQDGHWRECYGVGFHGDGSLCSTTDFAGVVQVWDLRTSKSIMHFLGHARRVLNAEFHPNGFQLATSGDDGTIKIWDLRRRKQAVSLPAHSSLLTGTKFDKSGEYLASSSFDGTVKLWSCRDWKMLSQMLGHDGKVSGVDILENNSLVTSGFDKTVKLWN